MTARNQPHKYRCETCKEQFDSDHIEYLHERCPMSRWLNTHTKLELLYSHVGVTLIRLITSVIGCYSHSDAIKAEQRIKDVIAELERRKGRLGTYPDNVQAIRTYESVIALLRGKEE